MSVHIYWPEGLWVLVFVAALAVIWFLPPGWVGKRSGDDPAVRDADEPAAAETEADGEGGLS